MVIILMMPAKMAIPCPLKTTVFWNKNYNVIIPAHEVNNNNLSGDSNYIVDTVMSLKFGNSNMSVREVIITSIL